MSTTSIDEPAGIHRIAVPTPFPIGPVNCYLLTGEPLTLIDVGPNLGTALDGLERGLAERGVSIEDLELIVLTHQHTDHGGLLEIIARRAGAEVAAFGPLAPWIADYPESATADHAYTETLARRHGLPDQINTVLGALGMLLRSNGSSGTVTQPLYDGDALTMGGRDFSVHHRPGHSPSDLVFFDADAGMLIGGDHLLASISSNAFLTRPLDGHIDGPRPTPLLDYRRSLQATSAMDASLILTGHRENVRDHAPLIDARLHAQEQRAEKILGLLSQEPLTAHEIAQLIWGEIAIKQSYLTLSEVLGHLDLLLADGTAAEIEAGDLAAFTAS